MRSARCRASTRSCSRRPRCGGSRSTRWCASTSLLTCGRQAASRHRRDDRLQRCSSAIPQFAQLRNPDGSLNQDAIGALGMSSGIVRRAAAPGHVAARQVLLGLGGIGDRAGEPPPRPRSMRMFQQREIQVERFEPKDYLAKVAPTDAEIEAYYKAACRAVPGAGGGVDRVRGARSRGAEEGHQGPGRRPAQVLRREREALHRRRRSGRPATSSSRPTRTRRRPSATRRRPRPRRCSPRFARTRRRSPSSRRKNSRRRGLGRQGRRARFLRAAARCSLKPFEDAAFALKPGEIERRRARPTSAFTSSSSTPCAAARRRASRRCGPSSRTRSATSWRRSASRTPRSSSPTWCTSSPTA